MGKSIKQIDKREKSYTELEQQIEKLRLKQKELTETLARFTALYDATPIGYISNDELERQVERRSVELEQSHQRLLKSEKLAAVGRVAVAIAQKFNDPLQAITNVLGGIHRRGSLEPEDLPLVNLAFDEVIKLNNLVRDLREFYQPTRGKTDLFDIRSELEKIIEMNRPLLIDKGIDIKAEFTENIPLIHAVADQLNSMFQNLLDKSIETCCRGDSIRITTSVEKDTIVSQFESSGCSIDQSAMSQIFDPLNLSNSKRLIEKPGT